MALHHARRARRPWRRPAMGLAPAPPARRRPARRSCAVRPPARPPAPSTPTAPVASVQGASAPERLETAGRVRRGRNARAVVALIRCAATRPAPGSARAAPLPRRVPARTVRVAPLKRRPIRTTSAPPRRSPPAGPMAPATGLGHAGCMSRALSAEPASVTAPLRRPLPPAMAWGPAHKARPRAAAPTSAGRASARAPALETRTASAATSAPAVLVSRSSATERPAARPASVAPALASTASAATRPAPRPARPAPPSARAVGAMERVARSPPGPTPTVIVRTRARPVVAHLAYATGPVPVRSMARQHRAARRAVRAACRRRRALATVQGRVRLGRRARVVSTFAAGPPAGRPAM